jgi:hypothetical protein
LPKIRRPEPAPTQSVTGDWTLTNIGDAYPRAALRFAPNEMMLWGGGRDLFAKRDEFGFCSRAISGNFKVSAGVTFEADVHKHAKAGLMARTGLEDDDPLVMVHIFPDDSCIAAVRRSRGAALEQFTLAEKIGAGARLSLERKGDVFVAELKREGRTVSHTIKFSGFPKAAQVGPFMLSHDIALSKPARFIDLLVKTSELPEPATNNTQP